MALTAVDILLEFILPLADGEFAEGG